MREEDSAELTHVFAIGFIDDRHIVIRINHLYIKRLAFGKHILNSKDNFGVWGDYSV